MCESGKSQGIDGFTLLCRILGCVILGTSGYFILESWVVIGQLTVGLGTRGRSA